MKNLIKRRFGKLLFISIFLSIALSSQAFAETWNWDASNIGCDGSWNDTNCWDTSDSIDVLPQSDDDVYFQYLSGGCTIDTGFTINSLELVSPYDDTITITSSLNLNILGNFTIGTGIINGGVGTIDVGGNFTQNGATVNLYGNFVVDGVPDWNGGVFDMNGNSASLGQSINHTYMNDAFITLDGTTSFNQDLYLNSGTLTTGVSNVGVGRNFNMDGGTITMSAGGSWDIDGWFDIDGGTVNANGSIYIDDRLDIASGVTYNRNSSTLIFDDTTASHTSYITDSRSSGAYDFAGLEVNMTGSGSTFEVYGNTTLAGNLILRDGSLTGTNTITTNGSFYCYNGFSGGSGTEVIMGGSLGTIGVIQNATNVPKFRLNNPNATVKRIGEESNSNPATFTGTVNIDQGNLDLFLDNKQSYTQVKFTSVPTIFSGQVTLSGGTIDMDHTQGADPIGGLVTFNSRYAQLGGTIKTNTAAFYTTFNDNVYVYEGIFTASTGDIIINGNTLVNTSSSYSNNATVNMSSSGSVDFNGNLSIGKIGSPSATFTPSESISYLSGDLNIYGGTNYSMATGILEFDGTTNSIVSLYDGVGSEDFARIDINKGSGTNYVSISTGDVMNVSSTLVLENGLLEGGGKISSNLRTTWNATFDGGTGTIVLKHSGGNNLTLPDGVPVTKLELDNTNHDSNLTVTTSGTKAQTIQGLTINNDPVGTGPVFTNSTAAIDLTFAGPVIINDGTFTDGDSNVLTFNSTFDINGGTASSGTGTLDHDSNVTIDGGTYTVNGSGNFDGQLSFNGGTLDASGATGLTSTSTDTNSAIVINTGTFTAPSSGTFSIMGGVDVNGGTFTNSGSLEITGAANSIWDSTTTLSVNNFTINKSEGYSFQYGNGTSPVMNVNGLLRLQNGEFNGNTTGTLYANNDLDWDTTFDGGTGNLYIRPSGNNFNFPDLSGLTDCLNITLSGANYSQLEMGTTSSNAISCFNNFGIESGVTFANDAEADITFKGNFDMNGGAFESVTGNIVHSGTTTLDGGSYSAGSVGVGTVTFSGTLSVNGGAFLATGANSVTSSSTNTTSAIVLNSGTFTPPANVLSIAGGLKINSDMFSMSQGTLEFTGSGNSYLDASPASISLNNLKLSKNSVGNTLYLGNTESDSTYNIAGALTVYGGTLHTNSKADINITGDWTICPSAEGDSTCQNAVDGVAKFTPGTKTVTFNGTGQTIAGPNDSTFYNFTKTVSSEDTLYFEAGETTVVTNTLTLQGASESARLLLRSTSVSPTASERTWYINPQGTRTISYVDVKDSTNTNATYIDVRSTGSLDSGNNVQWLFDGDEDPPEIPEFSSYLLLLISAIGVGLVIMKKEDLVKVVSKG